MQSSTGHGSEAGEATHAIVIGGSMTGLLAARVLSSHFDRVTILERDTLPDHVAPRKGTPQSRHVHALLYKGQRILERMFPGLFEEMGPEKPAPFDLTMQVLWHNFGTVSARDVSGLVSHFQSRPLLEFHVRKRVQQLYNVELVQRADVHRLLLDEGRQRVVGVEIVRDSEASSQSTLYCDLVVDASGRGTPLPRWLEALGFGAPPESSMKIDLAYATAVFHKPPGFARPWCALFALPHAPHSSRGGYLFPIEGDRWMVTLSSRHGDQPSTDPDGFMAFARSLPLPELHEAIQGAEREGQIVAHRVPSSLRRHYERMRHFPQRLVAMGDSVCSVNPVYGHGMTVSALEALALARRLRRSGLGRLDLVCDQVRRDCARIAAVPWLIVTTEDLRHPQAPGQRSLVQRFTNWYVRQLYRITAWDTRIVGQTLLEVMHMQRHPAALYGPGMLWRVAQSVLRLPVSAKARSRKYLEPASSTTVSATGAAR